MRAVLPALRVPTLVLHRKPTIRSCAWTHGRYLAEHIPDARYVELEGEDHHFFVGDTERLLDEIELFLTGAAAGAEPDRMLASVLFTDIVGSTDTRPRWATAAGASCSTATMRSRGSTWRASAGA